MPTSVSAARQCLTEEAARALDDAVAVACRRSHTQTTSLHAVSALLSLASSPLRDACARARSAAYAPRLQFRALELSVGVSLDRLQSSKAPADDEPPVSNSLMAAIKRSQANQRRHPQTFHLYQQTQYHNQSSLSCVKVELKHFILSILDDPIVSRVFGDAGYRSSDIKFAILHPPPISRFSRSKCPPPVFLCNLYSNPRPFPFAGLDNSDENIRRIGDILVKKKANNPLLIGVCAIQALNNFEDCIKRGKHGVVPDLIDGLRVISIEKEIREFFNEGGSKVIMEMKFKEVSDLVEICNGIGVVVNYGDLKVFVNGGLLGDKVRYVVDKLSSLVEIYGEKLWLIGAAGDYETYMEFVAQFSSVEKDWDLHLLPITSSKPFNGGSYSKTSLMGSFVPFAGFFPTPSELENLLGSTKQPKTRCNLCNEKYEQEVSVVLKGGSNISVADHHSATLPSWLQKDESDTNKRVNAVEAKDGSVLKARLMGLQKKWNDICQRLHHTRPFQQNIPEARSCVPGFEGFHRTADKNGSNDKDPLLTESRCTNLSSPMDLQKIFPPRQNIPTSVAFEAKNASFQHKLPVEHNSSSSITSVTTDLMLGTLYASSKKGPEKPVFKDHKDRLQSFSGSISAEVSAVSKSASNHIAQPSPCTGPYFGGQFDEKDFKYLSRVLLEKVSWQDEAICTISRAISRCRTGNGKHRGHRGDVWLSFLGPDRVGKKRIAATLAEIVFGSRESLISVDLSSEENSIGQSNSIFDHQGLNSYDVKFRGKTVVDYIAEELSRKPCSVLFLENLDKADFLAQHSLYRAIRTGKFPDSYGREISINNMIFVTTSSIMKVYQDFLSGKEPPEFSEERILGAKRSQIQILVKTVTGDMTRINGSNVFLSPKKGNLNPLSVNKRKLIDTGISTEQDESLEIPKLAQKVVRACLDLNMPVEEMEEDNDYGNCDSDSGSENPELWLEDFFDNVDEKVVFKPFDFDALAEKMLKEIGLVFREKVGDNVWLEIDEEVMVQMLAAAWLSEGERLVEDWIQKVLCKSFVEVQHKRRLAGHSVVKLVAFEGLFVDDEAPHAFLPARIILR